MSPLVDLFLNSVKILHILLTLFFKIFSNFFLTLFSLKKGGHDCIDKVFSNGIGI